MKHSSRLPILLTASLAKSLATPLRWNVCFIKNQAIIFSNFLGVHVTQIYVLTIITNSSFAQHSVCFFCYSNLHKGYKCLEIAIGRIYISRDVIFYETLFPFAKLHPNAGALLRAEISLLQIICPTLITGVNLIELIRCKNQLKILTLVILVQQQAMILCAQVQPKLALNHRLHFPGPPNVHLAAGAR